jgi:hypothetical protein
MLSFPRPKSRLHPSCSYGIMQCDSHFISIPSPLSSAFSLFPAESSHVSSVDILNYITRISTIHMHHGRDGRKKTYHPTILSPASTKIMAKNSSDVRTAQAGIGKPGPPIRARCISSFIILAAHRSEPTNIASGVPICLYDLPGTITSEDVDGSSCTGCGNGTCSLISSAVGSGGSSPM